MPAGARGLWQDGTTLKGPSVRIPVIHRGKSNELPGVAGSARLDRRTKRLTKRLRPGDIAIIDHVDLDRVGAEALVAAGVAAGVNASPSISARHPNPGPEILLTAGIPLVDIGDGDVFAEVRDGDAVRLLDETLYAADARV